MKLGGPKSMLDAVRAYGGETGPRSKWLTPGVENWGMGFIDTFFQECKRDGITPLVLFWTFGDNISRAAIRNGVNDKYQKNKDGSPILITQTKCVAWAKEMAQKAVTAGVSPIVIIENEYQKADLRDSYGRSQEFADYYDAIRTTIKTTCPTAKVCFAPGGWGDLALQAGFYQAQIEKSDLIGTMGLISRSTEAQYAAFGQRFLTNLKALRSVVPNKPAIIFDFAVSTYGGNVQSTPPHAPVGFKGPTAGETLAQKTARESANAKLLAACGRANDAWQILAFENLATVLPGLNVEAIVHRGITDLPNFDVKNHHGYGERFFGVVRADGTKKPGYDALLSISKLATPTPSPMTRTEQEYQTALTERDSARRDLGEVQFAFDELRARHLGLRRALQTLIDETP